MEDGELVDLTAEGDDSPAQHLLAVESSISEVRSILIMALINLPSQVDKDSAVRY